MSRVLRAALCLGLVLTLAGSGRAQVSPQNSQSVNPDVLALNSSADMVIGGLRFTALGEVAFNLENRGAVGVNLPAKAMPGTRATPAGPPILIEVFIGDSRITIQQPSLGGRQTRALKVPLPSNIPKPKCLETRALRVRVDPQNVVRELYDDNNEVAVTEAQRPCPDLAVVKIERDKEGVMGELYRVKVTVTNKGNAPSPATKVWGTTLTSAPGLTSWPELNPTHNLGELQPGETASFKIGGSTLSSEVSYVRIILDRFFHIDESDESNNFIEKKL